MALSRRTEAAPTIMRHVRWAAVLVAAAGCATPIRTTPEGTPSAVTLPAADSPATTTGRRASAPNEADVRFMLDMIGHHQQALDMTRLVPQRSSRDDLRLLAQRIETSQTDEIALMRRWLARQGAAPADSAGPHSRHGAAARQSPMPGMLSGEESRQLVAATGPAFDRLFLQFMIRHHEGALAMVRTLFATTGAAQHPEVFRLASDVDADQRAEIARMRTLLRAMPDS